MPNLIWQRYLIVSRQFQHITECSPIIKPAHGYTKGNMFEIGSAVALGCEDGFTDFGPGCGNYPVKSECRSNGSHAYWSVELTCVKGIIYYCLPFTRTLLNCYYSPVLYQRVTIHPYSINLLLLTGTLSNCYYSPVLYQIVTIHPYSIKLKCSILNYHELNSLRTLPFECVLSLTGNRNSTIWMRVVTHWHP